jgi:protein-tyrosine phosphatase
MVDLHSHIIWEIDDGSKSKEMTLKMLKLAIRGGTKKIVSTPHFLPGHYENSIEDIKREIEKVKDLIKEQNLDIEVLPGQEVYYTDNILEHYNNNLIGTINSSRYMLIELNMRDFKLEEVISNLYELQLKGITPVIAHPERYIKFLKNPSLINEFSKEGYIFQLNAGSLTGDFGKEVKNLAEKYVSSKIYSVFGSDAHRDEKRNTNMKNFIEGFKDKSYLQNLNNNNECIIYNKKIDINNNLFKEKKGIFKFFK